jgi:hypothetical protein
MSNAPRTGQDSFGNGPCTTANRPRRKSAKDPREPKGGKESLHERVIRQLIASDPRMCRNGFARAIEDLWAEIGGEPDELPPIHFMPDAYLIDRDLKELVLFEVGDWRLATQAKEAALGQFWLMWDSCVPDGWAVGCIALDRFGMFSHEMDLCSFFVGTLAEFSPKYAGLMTERSQESNA